MLGLRARNVMAVCSGRIARAGTAVISNHPAMATALAAVLLAALTTQAATAGNAAATAATAPTQAASSGLSYVSLGDSYTSGPFIPKQTGRPIGCLRSNHNYPSLIAAARRAASFTDVSCQGATTANITQSESVAPLGTNPPQLNALTKGTSLVTLQIGGNDIDFEGIVVKCAELSFTKGPFGSPCKDYYTRGGTDRLAKAIAQTAPKVAAVLKLIHQDSPSARVLLLGYPVILPNTGDGCWPLVPFAFGDVPYLRGVEIKLNRMLAAQAAVNKATFVDTYTDSIGHDACEPASKKWVEGLLPTSPAGPLHPDAAGERAMAAQVLAALR